MQSIYQASHSPEALHKCMTMQCTDMCIHSNDHLCSPAIAACAAAAAVAAVTPRVRSRRASSIRPPLTTLHRAHVGLHHSTLDHSRLGQGLRHSLSPGVCTGNGWQLRTDRSTVSGVAAATSGTAVAASTDGAAV